MVSTKIGDNRPKSPISQGQNRGGALDKLAQLSPNLSKIVLNSSDSHKRGKSSGKDESASNGLKTLSKRARGKYLTNGFINRLRGLDSPLRKGYLNSFFCSSVLHRKGQKITSTYCGNRWCITCNRIRTANLISGYCEELSALEDPQFVTLTIPGKTKGIQIPEDELPQAIEKMISDFRGIVNLIFRKRKMKVSGIRKLECTYSPHRNDFHPHFHIIINKKENAETLRTEWLKKYPLGNIEANDIRQCDEGSLKEIFKYFTKLLNGKKFYPKAQDIMFQAMKGKRIIQPFGAIKKVNEDVQELRAEVMDELSSQEEGIYKWQEGKTFADWIDQDSGEMLTGYEPSEELKTLRDSV